jgi:hypothetical protein
MDNIKSNVKILLQPGETKHGVRTKVTIKDSNITDGPGYINYGLTVSGVSSYLAYKQNADGSYTTFTNTDIYYSAPTVVSGIYVDAELKYPGSDGSYKLKYNLLLSDGSVKPLVIDRVLAKEL